MPLPVPPSTLLESLAGYPRWFVAACLTVVAAVVLWILAKLLKWGLQVLLVLVVIAGAAATVWLFMH